MDREANRDSDTGREAQGSPADHRAIVREINRSLAVIYGIGGTVVLLAMAGLLVGAWWAGWIWSILPWLGAVVIALIGLIVVRMVVYRRADELYERLEAYCRTNAIEPEQLRAHFRDENLYPFFESLFELKARRERLARGEPIDGSEPESSR